MCICIYIYTHHIEDYKGMFETPDQYVMGHITCTSKNISTAFRITSRRWINVCVCAWKSQSFLGACTRTSCAKTDRTSKSQMLISSETNLTDWNIPTMFFLLHQSQCFFPLRISRFRIRYPPVKHDNRKISHWSGQILMIH